MNHKARVYLFGCGVTARAVHAYFKNHSQYSIEGFVVDEQYYTDRIVDGLPLLSFQRLKVTDKASYSFVVCIGYSKLNLDRATIYQRLVADGWSVVSLYDKSYEDFFIEVGEGSIIMPGAFIQPHVKIGRCVTIWPGAIIGHDTCIGDYCWLTAGTAIGGNSVIGERTFLGINSVVVNII